MQRRDLLVGAGIVAGQVMLSSKVLGQNPYGVMTSSAFYEILQDKGGIDKTIFRLKTGVYVLSLSKAISTSVAVSVVDAAFEQAVTEIRAALSAALELYASNPAEFESRYKQADEKVIGTLNRVVLELNNVGVAPKTQLENEIVKGFDATQHAAEMNNQPNLLCKIFGIREIIGCNAG